MNIQKKCGNLGLILPPQYKTVFSIKKEKLMDRNDKFRKRLENKLNQTISKGSSKFDPTPYVNILMDNTHWEDDDEEELEDSVKEIANNPDLDFILGHSSVLNMAQKQMVAKEFQHRLNAIFEFDSSPFVNELLEIWETKEFDKYKYTYEDGEEEIDLKEFYKKHRLTKEQKARVEEHFFEEIGYSDEDTDDEKFYKPVLVQNPPIGKKDKIAFALLVLIFVVTPAFLIPNYLQRIGWLAPNTGWFMKIAVGIMSAIALAFIWQRLINFFATRVFKIKN
jgi:hypothetical protein